MANEEGQNPDRECDLCETDLGWKGSNAAGGATTGEGGGLLHRSGGLPIGFYGDTTIGELTLDMPISASGKVTLVNTDFDGHAHFGFFDGNRLLEDPLDFGAELGFFLAEPGGGVAPNFRWGHTVRSDTGVENRDHNGFIEGAPDSESLDFSINYDPAGDGLLTLVLGDEPEVEVELTPDLRDDGATLTAFGIWTGAFLGSADARSLEILLDDITYTSTEGGGATALHAGDADQDFDFDQLDLVKVQVTSDLTVVGSLAGGGDLGNVELIYVPEPSAIGILFMGMLLIGLKRRSDR
jgi:hypothetical protein